MRIEGESVSVAARVVRAIIPSASGWVKRGAIAREIAASTIALAEMWKHVELGLMKSATTCGGGLRWWKRRWEQMDVL